MDGVPYSFLQRLFEIGYLPNMRRIFSQGSFVRMNSVDPCVSSVAWTSFNTGMNPGKHGIFGFVDRDPRSNSLYIPTARQIAVPTIAETLSELQRRVVTINVPGTFPPKPMNGVQISGFLAPSLDNAVCPVSYLPTLKQFNYVIDVDASEARTNARKFLQDINSVFESRVNTARYLLDHEYWDYFHLHIMNTDRINHFFWDDHPEDRVELIDFYNKIDSFLSDLNDRLDSQIEFIVLSDHGFCRVKTLINLNAWLMRNSYMNYTIERDLFSEQIDPSWKAFSLYPGRIYLNHSHRSSMMDFDTDVLINKLNELRDPETNVPVFKKIYRKQEIFRGPHIDVAPDLQVIPEDGFELKSNFEIYDVFYKDTYLKGMHTNHDAFFYIRNRQIIREQLTIMDIRPTIFNLLNIPLDCTGLDGSSII